MFITINGHLGSGKSAVCNFFKSNYGFEIFSTGRIQREYASKIGVSTLEMNEISKNDDSLDRFIDDAVVQYAKDHINEKVIFDSRLAWHFVPKSFKVRLLVSPAVAANRVFCNRKAEEEKYTDENDALEKLIDRRKLEEERYFDVYGLRMSNFSNYDLILDTTTLTEEEVCQIIYDEYNNFLKPDYTQKIFVSPKNIYPTESIRNCNTDIYKEYCEKISETYKEEQLSLIKADDSLFIIDGHHRVLAANKVGVNVFPAILLCQEDEVMSNGISAKDYVTMTLSDIYDWEDACNFKFNYYPNIIKKQEVSQ